MTNAIVKYITCRIIKRAHIFSAGTRIRRRTAIELMNIINMMNVLMNNATKVAYAWYGCYGPVMGYGKWRAFYAEQAAHYGQL